MVEQSFVAAAKAGVICELIDREGRRRTVEPYMVYKSRRGKRLFHFYQLDGYSESGKAVGWKNPEVAAFAFAAMTETPFRPRPEYNPANTTMFTEIFFAVPKMRAATA